MALRYALPDNTPAVPIAETRQARAIGGRSKRGRVTGKLRRAIEAMVWEGSCRPDAAKSAGLRDHSLREALRKAHVKAYYRGQLEVLRTSERARNIHRLCEIRDAADNMPAVQAIKAFEQMAEVEPEGGSGQPQTPGLVIRIVSAVPSDPGTKIIDVTPRASGRAADFQGD